jgi:homoserine dehydrogenase
MHVVLANKGPVAVDYAGLKARADAAGVLLHFEATVMAGTPALRLALQDLAGCKITAVRGILNGTTNYILVQMEQGMSYAAALAQAQTLGYAESDPAADVEGWDSAGKAVILAAALYGKALTLEEMHVEGITGLTQDDITTAHSAGERWKLVATVTPEGGRVEPVRLPRDSALAGVGGAMNAITLTTDPLGNVTLFGPGAGRVQTGFGLLADLLDIYQRNS